MCAACSLALQMLPVPLMSGVVGGKSRKRDRSVGSSSGDCYWVITEWLQGDS